MKKKLHTDFTQIACGLLISSNSAPSYRDYCPLPSCKIDRSFSDRRSQRAVNPDKMEPDYLDRATTKWQD